MPPPTALTSRPLGKDGPLVPRIGFGLLNNSGGYGVPPTDEQRLAFLDKAYDLGQVFWDTADIYGDSELLLNKWFALHPDKRSNIFLATKCGIKTGADHSYSIDSSPAYVLSAVDKSLARLGLDYIDLLYIHRLDLTTPIEKTMSALVSLVKAGKVRYLGLSDPSAASLRRACAIHHIAAVQMEYNPFTTDIELPEHNFLATARELGVAIVTYSPLGRGILGGQIKGKDDVSKEGDIRRAIGFPWYQDGNLENNLSIVGRIGELASKKGCTPAQLTLAWILKQGADLFPIPGTTKLERLKENLGAMEVELSDEEEAEIRKLGAQVKGSRATDAHLKHSFADTPPLEE